MADSATADTGLLPRTYFRAPRVPLDLRALMLALIAYGVFRAGNELLNLMFKDKYPVSSFFDALLGLITVPYIGGELGRFVHDLFLAGQGPGDPGFGYVLIGGVWSLAVLGFFGQGIHRITSLRIARDEGMPLKDALKFSASNFKTIAICPIVIGGAIGLFYGCNALAGALIAIPFAGAVFAVILVPLALISSLLILLIAIGGVLGLPLVGAAAAWERNGSLDAISRAFSYIFARPLQFFWNYFLIFLFTSVILIAGGHFQKILTGSVDALVWRDSTSILIDTPTEGRDAEKYDADSKKLAADLVMEDHVTARPLALDIHAVSRAPWESKGQVLVFWIVLNLIRFGVLATAFWWFIGATTSTYADLRSDVDGTEEDEIYLEEEEQDFDALATPPATPPGPLSAPAAPAAPLPPPPPPPPPPPTA